MYTGTQGLLKDKIMAAAFENLSGAKAARVAGKSAQNIAEFNAKVAEQQSEAAKLKSKFAQKRQAKKAVSIESSLIARLAKGGGLGSPVAADLIAEQASELELENLLIGFEGEVEAKRLLNQAELERLQGQAAKAAGKAAGRRANLSLGLSGASIGVTAGLAFKKPPTSFMSGFGTSGFP